MTNDGYKAVLQELLPRGMKILVNLEAGYVEAGFIIGDRFFYGAVEGPRRVFLIEATSKEPDVHRMARFDVAAILRQAASTLVAHADSIQF